MDNREAHKEALFLIAQHDHPDADEFDQHVLRMARRWMRLLKARHPIGPAVLEFASELCSPPPGNYGCAWDALREKFITWATTNGWVADSDITRMSAK